MEELVKKEFPFITSLSLEELLLKLESRNIIYVFRVSKNKKMVVYNKDNTEIRSELTQDSV
ncbi:MAG: hypothetical protein ACFFBP_11200 [Promethearchaeota archaeon]